MTKEESAQEFDRKLRELDSVAKRGFAERGLILREMRDKQLWRLLTDSATDAPYTSFDRYLLSACPWSSRDAYASMKAADVLKEIPTATLSNMPRGNIAVLQVLSPAIRRKPEILQAAQAMRERDFIRMIEEKHPEQHLEPAHRTLDEAIALAMYVENTTSRRAAEEAVASSYLAEYADDYAALKGKGVKAS